MKTIILKLLHDLWLNKTKFVLCVIAASLSTWGISSFIYSYAFATRDFIENFSSTSPADFSITTTPFTDSLIAEIKKIPNVKGIERREAIVGRVNEYGRTMSITLFGVEDFEKMSYNTFQLTENKSNLYDGVYIEQNAMRFIDGSKDSLVIKFNGNDSLKLYKSGVAHDPGLPPAEMEQTIYAYTSIKNLNKYRLANQRLLVKTNLESPSQKELKAVAEAVTHKIQQGGSAVSSLVIPEWGKHPHQAIVDGIAFLQKSFGAVFSLLGIVLLSLVLLTWIFPQLPHVGIMKAIGASTRSIISAYLVVLVLILALGLAIGMPLGFVSATAYNRFIAMIQNFDVVKEPLPLLYHASIVTISLVIPLLFCITILNRISKTTVNNALSQTFSSSGSIWFRLTQKLITPSKLKYITNNLWRNNQRTFLMILLLCFGIALFFTGKNLEYSIKTDFSKTLRQVTYNALVNLDNRYTDSSAILKKLPFVKKSSPLLAEIIQYESRHTGYDESATLFIHPPEYQFNESMMYRGNFDRLCTDCFYVNQRMTEDFKDVALGEQIRFTRKDGSSYQLTFGGVIKDQSGNGMYQFSSKPLQSYNLLAVDIEPDSLHGNALTRLEAFLQAKSMGVLRIYNTEELLVSLDNHLAPTYKVIQYTGIFTLVVGMLGLLLVLNLAIQERMGEIGILKAIGCNSPMIVTLIRNEFLAINLIAMSMGIALSYFLSIQLCGVYGVGLLGIGFDPAFNWAVIVLSVAVLLMAQAALVTLYCRYKVKRTSRELFMELG